MLPGSEIVHRQSLTATSGSRLARRLIDIAVCSIPRASLEAQSIANRQALSVSPLSAMCEALALTSLLVNDPYDRRIVKLWGLDLIDPIISSGRNTEADDHSAKQCSLVCCCVQIITSRSLS